MKTVTIIGCGIIGAMIAYELSKSDLDVTVLEANAKPALGSTGAALGVLMAASSAKAKGDLVKLRLASLQAYDPLIDDLIKQTNLDILYNRQGIFNLYRAADITKLRSLIAIRQEQGFALQWLDQDAISHDLPQFQTNGALFSPCDRAVHPTQLVKALITAATQNGVKFVWQSPVQDLKSLSCDRMVITSGMGANPLLAQFLPSQTQDLLQPVGGQAIRVKVPHLNLQTVVHAENEDGSDFNIVPLGDDQYWLGATVEFEYEQLPREANVGLLIENAISWCPIFADAEVLETWAGERPRPRSNRAPILGFVPDHEHMLVATGHYRNGIMMSPVTAKITRDLLLTGASDLPWQPFSLNYSLN